MATFDCSNSLEKFRKCFPEGRAFKELYNKGSNFYNLALFFVKVFEKVCKDINNIFDGFFLSESDYLLDYHKQEYSIPNEYLPNDNPKENAIDNIVDAYVYAHLLHDNTKEGFVRVANAYGLRAKVEIIDIHKIEITLFHKISGGFQYIFLEDNISEDGVIYFGGEREYQKLLNFFYQKMKPAHVKLNVVIAEVDSIETYLNDKDEPCFAGDLSCQTLRGKLPPPPLQIGGKIVKMREILFEEGE